MKTELFIKCKNVFWLTVSCFLFLTVKTMAKPISGAFIQINPHMAGYTQANWDEEIGLMSRAGMDTVIVAPSIADGVAHYPSALPFVTKVEDNGLIMILNACDTYNIKCLVGLVGDGRWWTDRSDTVLSSMAANNIAAADELLPLVSPHTSFAGWYMTEEIVFHEWTGTSHTRLINILLNPVVNHLKAITPDMPVANAPFVYDFNAGADACFNWWNYTLSQVDFDITMLQDGLGADQNRQPEQIIPYFKNLAVACHNNGVQFWNDLETFNQSDWSAKTFSDARIQIDISKAYVDKIVTFEWFYITPTQRMRGWIRTTDRQNFYVKMLAHNKGFELASLNKTYTSSITPSASYPDTNRELTDSQIDWTMASQVGFFLSGTQDFMITIDLRENISAKYGFSATIMKQASWGIVLPSRIQVYASEDNQTFNYVTQLTTFPASGDSLNVYFGFPQQHISARYIRFKIRATNWLMCSELSVYRSAPTGDYNFDFKIDMQDVAELAGQWLHYGTDGTIINNKTFAVLAANWKWHRDDKETYRNQFYKLGGVQLTQDSPYMQGRSVESIASELSVNGVESVFIIPTSTDGIKDGIVTALHEKGIGAGLMMFADSVYTSPSIFPPGWEGWLMEFLNTPNVQHLSFIHDGYRQWMKQRAAALCNTYGFDAITFAEPMYPVYDGVTRNPVVYADVSSAYQNIFKTDTGETNFPDFTNSASPYYFKTNTALYQKLVQHRKDSITNYFDEIINGTGGLRQSSPDTLVVTWSLACSKLQNGGVGILPEWEGNDAYSIVKKAKPDIHYFQTHWPDWCDSDLSPEHVYYYIDNFKEAWHAMPDVPVGVQDDIGSMDSMRRSNQYYNDFLAACEASNVANSTYYCFDIRGDIYEAAPQLKRISKGIIDSNIVLEFDQRIHSNSAAIMSQRTITSLSNGTCNVLSATVDGNLLKVQLDKSIESGEILSVDVGGISDDPSVRWVTPDIAAGQTNTISAGTVIELRVK
ncbi:MAG: DUF4434 domain-containing protein [Planctomycetaceae bacterium]|nr:DUF4434 domain-containing protein [Planctomycetaceae bacterium]